jgi:hypothetical protein
MVPCPGKKTFASPKKALVPLFPVRASAFSAQRFLCHRVSLRRQRGGNREDFSRPFLASAPAFLPGQQENGSERPTNLEKIQKNFPFRRAIDEPEKGSLQKFPSGGTFCFGFLSG